MDCTSQGQNFDKRFVLQVPSMLPDEVRPYWGIFMRAHIESALSVNVPVVSYYGYSLPSDVLAKTEPLTIEEVSTQWGTYEQIRQRNRQRTGWQIKGYLQFIRWVKEHRHQIQLIHAHGLAWGGIWSLLACRKFNIPVIVTEHSSSFPRNTHPRILKQLFKWLLPEAEAVLPITKNLGTYLKPYAEDVPQYYVPNCVDTELFSPSPLPEKTRPFRILYVGSFVEVKNVDLLIKACSIINKEFEIQMTLVGSGPLKDELEKQATELGLQDRVHFAGHLPSEKVQEAMKESHMLALSSKWESQPCVLIESMLSGRPVAAPDVGGVSEMFTEESGELFTAGDLDGLVQAIRTIRDRIDQYNPERISLLSRTRHSIQNVGAQLRDIYEKYGCEFEEEPSPQNRGKVKNFKKSHVA